MVLTDTKLSCSPAQRAACARSLIDLLNAYKDELQSQPCEALRKTVRCVLLVVVIDCVLVGVIIQDVRGYDMADFGRAILFFQDQVCKFCVVIVSFVCCFSYCL